MVSPSHVLLINAACDGDAETVRGALADTSIPLKSINDALRDAALWGRANVVKTILDSAKSVNVNDVDLFNRTPLILGALHGDVVRALLAHNGVDVNAADDSGRRALMTAAENGVIDVVRALLAYNGVDVNAADDSGRTALMMAAEEVNVNAADRGGRTALMMAVQKGDIDVVRALLAHKRVNVNAADNSGITALMMAAEEGHIDVVRALLAHDGVNVDAADNRQNTALMIAAYKGYANIVQAFLQYSANADAVSKYGYTALMLAAHEGHAHIVHQLMSRTDISKRNKYGQMALDIALAQNHIIISLILRSSLFLFLLIL